MGILNATPDSFSDGGQFTNTESAFVYAIDLIKQGADIIDIGGESTRPGAEPVALQQELDRVIPIIEHLSAESDAPISIDSYKPEVMHAAVNAGAHLINDVNGLLADGALEVAAKAQVPICIMHMLGKPQTMQRQPSYDDVVGEVIAFFAERVEACLAVGIDRDDLIFDPGIGFGKTLEDNLALLSALPVLRKELESEVLIGVSRKSMIDALFGRTITERLPASLGLAVQAAINGAKILRVHDVRATFDAVRSAEAVMKVKPLAQNR